MDRVQSMQKIADIAVGSSFENLRIKLRAVFGAKNVESLDQPFPHYRITGAGFDEAIIVANSHHLSDAEHRVGNVAVD